MGTNRDWLDYVILVVENERFREFLRYQSGPSLYYCITFKADSLGITSHTPCLVETMPAIANAN